MPPHLIKLQKPGKFRVIVCHIIDPSNFYIRPSQQASVKTEVSSVLFDYFGDDFNVAETDREYVIGDLCSTRSTQHSEWCRGIVTDLEETNDEKKCLVRHLDYGDSHWYTSGQLKALPGQLIQYPAQAVHCCLSNVHPSTEGGGWKNESLERFKQLVTGSQLVAFVVNASEFITVLLHM